MFKPVSATASANLRPPRVLIVGDDGGAVRAALETAAPGVAAVGVATVFDAIAELQAEEYGAVLVHVGPIEPRAEAAVRSLREQLSHSPTPSPPRLILFGESAREATSRLALDFGGDDYVLLPPRPDELRQALIPRARAGVADAEEPRSLPLLPDDVPLATIALDALMTRAGASLPTAIERINTYLPTAVRLELADDPPASPDTLAVPLRAVGAAAGDGNGEPAVPVLVLHVPGAADDADRDVARHDLQQLAGELSKLAELDVRHAQLQRLALTDELTGCYNRRYFRHYLEKMLVKARADRFPVTLLIFDIDDFKHYNDRHGHKIGDAILRQTAELIKRCVRDHDLVARIGGDEFAVVFWEKDAPRIPHDPAAAPAGRFPRGPLAIAARFRRLMAEPDFFALGATGQGTLTISGGMAVFPFDAQTTDELIDAADHALIFSSKRTGKNSISLVGEQPGDSEFDADLNGAPRQND